MKDLGYNYFKIGRVPIAITNTEDAINRIKDAIRSKKKGYVCVSNMRTVTIANKDSEYLQVMNDSLFNTPDGTPLIWCARAWGIKKAQRACGPHIFRALLQDSEFGFKHFFLGDTDSTLEKLTHKCQTEYSTDNVGSYSPPFKPLEEYDLEGIARMINDSGANLVWTSLRAPKQDILAHMLMPYINDGIVFVGVGAAFRFELGEYKQPDGFLQKVGLAGLGAYRGTGIWKEIKWYFKHTFYLCCYLLAILFRRVIGKKYYE